MEDTRFLETGSSKETDREFEKQESEFDYYERFKDEPTATAYLQINFEEIEHCIRQARRKG